MVDKAITVKSDKVGPAFGRIDADAPVEVERCLTVFLGNAKKVGQTPCKYRNCVILLRSNLIASLQNEGQKRHKNSRPARRKS